MPDEQKEASKDIPIEVIEWNKEENNSRPKDSEYNSPDCPRNLPPLPANTVLHTGDTLNFPRNLGTMSEGEIHFRIIDRELVWANVFDSESNKDNLKLSKMRIYVVKVDFREQ